MLPDWIDTENLRWIILVAIGVLVAFMYWVARVIRNSLVRIVTIIVIAGLGVSLWVQRESLADCVEECSCSLYGRSVQIPADRIPDFC